MTQSTYYKNIRPVRSPFQPNQKRRNPRDEQDQGSSIHDALRKLCQVPYRLSASFSLDETLMSELKTPGLLAVKCELSLLDDNRVIGIGHGATVISRLNRATPRAMYSCLNGSLMSAISQGCKSLDVLRLEASDEQAESEKTAIYREAYGAHESSGSNLASDKQKDYLRQLISLKVEDESEREQWMSQLDDLTKEDASEAIQRFAK